MARATAAGSGIVVAGPRTIAVERANPGALSAGDRATVEVLPGLLDFLLLRDASSHALGEGLAPDFEVPIGAAGAACYAVFAPDDRVAADGFTGVRNIGGWRRPAVPGETLLATARIAAIGRTSLRLSYAVTGAEGSEVVSGELVFVAVREGRPVPVVGRLDRAAPPARPGLVAVLAAAWRAWRGHGAVSGEGRDLRADLTVAPPPFRLLRPTRLPAAGVEGGLRAGARCAWSFPCDLLRLLLSPIAGATSPLGRGFHPLGRVPEGAAVHAWLDRLGDGWTPAHFDVHYVAPLDPRQDLALAGELTALDGTTATTRSELSQDGRLVTRVELELARSGFRHSPAEPEEQGG